MVFFVTLALALNFGLSSVAKTWMTGLSGTLTIEIKPPMSDDGTTPAAEKKRFENSVNQVLLMLKGSADVGDARLLTAGEIKNLIAPWVGRDTPMDDLPLPALIDVKLAHGADTARLQTALKILEPSALIDSHTDTLDDVRALVRTATLFMLLLTGIISALAVVTIAGIVRSKLLIHQAEVETLHLIGASDEYIARQFRRHILRGTLRGALAGVAATVAVLLLAGAVTQTSLDSVVPHLTIAPLQWAILLLAPILAGSLIAHLTAQATVLRELARLP
jgi:cell division transport system permease protein